MARGEFLAPFGHCRFRDNHGVQAAQFPVERNGVRARNSEVEQCAPAGNGTREADGLDGGMAPICLTDWLGRPPTAEEMQGFMAMRLAAAMRDLFWGYAQDGLVASRPGKLDGYIAINENRVRVAAAGL